LHIAFQAERRHTGAVDYGALQGWHADPFGLHEMRYFSSGRPTKLVRDGTVDAYDEPPAEGFRSAAVAAGAASGSGPGPMPDGAWPRGGLELAASMPQDHLDVRAIPARRRHRLAYATIALVALGAVLASAAIAGRSGSHGIAGRSGSPAMAPAAFVTVSAQRTVAQKTAKMALSGNVQMGDRTISLHGNGQVDFATSAFAFSVSYSFSPTAFTETLNEILVGGNLYLRVTSNGHSFPGVPGGRRWLEMSAGQSRPQDTAESDPASLLRLLEKKGARVTSLGTMSIDGRSCRGYDVTPASDALQGAAPVTLRIWLDPQRQLACQMTIKLQIEPASAGSFGISAQLLMSFTDYGEPVTIAPPPPSDTISLQKAVGQSA
jgi:hypothetical protein